MPWRVFSSYQRVSTSSGLTHKTKETGFLALILRIKSVISRSETRFLRKSYSYQRVSTSYQCKSLELIVNG
ncbi:MAG: hypothetical protein ACRC2M_07200 [Planktothrix sp.]